MHFHTIARQPAANGHDSTGGGGGDGGGQDGGRQRPRTALQSISFLLFSTLTPFLQSPLTTRTYPSLFSSFFLHNSQSPRFLLSHFPFVFLFSSFPSFPPSLLFRWLKRHFLPDHLSPAELSSSFSILFCQFRSTLPSILPSFQLTARGQTFRSAASQPSAVGRQPSDGYLGPSVRNQSGAARGRRSSVLCRSAGVVDRLSGSQTGPRRDPTRCPSHRLTDLSDVS